MVVKKSAGGRTLSLSTTANGTAAAVAGNLQSGVPFLPKSPSFHSGLDLLAGREKSPIIMFCDPTMHLPRLHGESYMTRSSLLFSLVKTKNVRGTYVLCIKHTMRENFNFDDGIIFKYIDTF